MSNKTVHLFIVGKGDPELQQLIKTGMSEIGHDCETTPVALDPALILDALSEGQLPVVIKPV